MVAVLWVSFAVTGVEWQNWFHYSSWYCGGAELNMQVMPSNFDPIISFLSDKTSIPFQLYKWILSLTVMNWLPFIETRDYVLFLDRLQYFLSLLIEYSPDNDQTKYQYRGAMGCVRKRLLVPCLLTKQYACCVAWWGGAPTLSQLRSAAGKFFVKRSRRKYLRPS